MAKAWLDSSPGNGGSRLTPAAAFQIKPRWAAPFPADPAAVPWWWMATAALLPALRGTMACAAPFCQITAAMPAGPLENPATAPESLIPLAPLEESPAMGASRVKFWPPLQVKARMPASRLAVAATWPRLVMPQAYMESV